MDNKQFLDMIQNVSNDVNLFQSMDTLGRDLHVGKKLKKSLLMIINDLYMIFIYSDKETGVAKFQRKVKEKYINEEPYMMCWNELCTWICIMFEMDWYSCLLLSLDLSSILICMLN